MSDLRKTLASLKEALDPQSVDRLAYYFDSAPTYATAAADAAASLIFDALEQIKDKDEIFGMDAEIKDEFSKRVSAMFPDLLRKALNRGGL